MRKCKERGCSGITHCKGLCKKHYNRIYMREYHRRREKVDPAYKAYRIKAANDWHEGCKKKGLCGICAKPAAERVIFQEGVEMHRKVMIYCFGHLRRHLIKNRAYSKKNKNSCSVCHSNPAELCRMCQREKRT